MESESALLERSKLAEQTERYDDMKQYMKSFVEKKKTLADDERNLLSVGYKNVVGSRRSAWRIISAMEAKADSAAKQKVAGEYRKKIEDELNEICDEVIALLDNYLISSDDKLESKVFYQKMKGDYYRYKVEVASDASKDNIKSLSQQAYEQATNLATEKMDAMNPIRLGLALNYSVFYYEIMNESSKACELAKEAFDKAMMVLQDDQDPNEQAQKDSMLIMQLLRDNLTLWNETSEEQDEQQEN